MQTKTFKIRRDKESEPVTLSRPHPENDEEMASLCDDPANGPRTLAIRQYVVDLQAEARREWKEQTFDEGSEEEHAWLQTFVDNFRYGGGRGAPRTKVVSGAVFEGLSPEVIEALRAQNVVISGA
jgi:hypothetical protein